MYGEYPGNMWDAERIDKDACRKYRVVVGCMVSLSVVLGALLLHGAVKAVSNAKSAYIVLYALGFCVIVAVPLLIWNSCRYLQYIEKKQKISNGYEPLDDCDRDFLQGVKSSIYAELLDGHVGSLCDYENSKKDDVAIGRSIDTQIKEGFLSSSIEKMHDVTKKNSR